MKKNVFALIFFILSICFVFFSCKKDNSIAVTGMNPSKDSITLAINTKDSISIQVSPSNATNKIITWKSSNSSIVFVNSTGVILGLAVGTATVTATSIDGSFSTSCAVSVIVPTTGISISKQYIVLGINCKTNLLANLLPANATCKNVIWRTSNPSVVTVNSLGTVTAIASGTDTITATTWDNFKAKCIILSIDPIYNGLVAYYHLNGNFRDTTANQNNGIQFGSFSTESSGNMYNNTSVYKFNGVNSYVRVPNSASLNPSTQMSVSVWYKPVNFYGSGNDPIIDKPYPTWTKAVYQYHLGVTGALYLSPKIGFDIALNDTLRYAVTPPNSYIPGVWYHIVGTYDGSFIKIYLNNNLMSSTPATGIINNEGQDLFIGRYGLMGPNHNDYSYLPGNIAELRIYNRALSSIEINNIFLLGN